MSRKRELDGTGQMERCLVLGSSGGIGSAVVAILRARGVSFVGLDRARAGPTSEAESAAMNVGSYRSVRDSLGRVVRRFGVPSVVICCIGSYSRVGLEQYSQSRYAATMRDNFDCIFWVTKVLVPQLVGRGGGRLVVTTSQAGTTGGYDPVYAGAKAACGALIKSVAREYGRLRVRCNGVSPGPVDTAAARAAMGRSRIDTYRKSIPIGRLSEAEEVASLLVYLAFDAPDALNGAIFDIDGGLVRR